MNNESEVSAMTDGNGEPEQGGERRSGRSRWAMLGFLIVLALAIAGATIAWKAYKAGAFGSTATAATTVNGREVDYYTCSMHPYLREPKPGNCPACGMKLQPVYKITTNTAAADSQAAPGTVHVSAEEERLLGIRTVVAKRGAFSRTIRTVGRVEVSEDRLAHVHTRFEGWIDRLFVNSVGQVVNQGDPLFSIYSPQIVSAQEEYLLALRARNALGANVDTEAARGVNSLLDAARDRLQLWEVSEETIRRLETTKRVERTLTVYSPVTGYVQTRNITAGQQIMPGTDMYVIADLTNVWVTADVFERDMANLQIGQLVTAKFTGEKEKVYEGRISFVYPYLDENTRTNKIRISLDNPGLRLKPGMFGDITIGSTVRDTYIMVPVDAVMVTGVRDVVFVRTAPGVYTPMDVKIGDSSDGYYQILSGLNDGDVVVERGNFFLDSESQLRMTGSAGAHAGMDMGKSADVASPSAPPASSPATGAQSPPASSAPGMEGMKH